MSWLLRAPDPAADARLFCFPYSGCGASIYTQWPRWIGGIEVCPIQPPARQNRIREPHYETYEALGAALVEFLPPYLDKPFAFFGHCGGALPGVEVTRQLVAAGLPAPRRLFVSAQVAPHDGPYGRLLELDDDGLREELGRIIEALGGTPSKPLLDLALKLLVQDVEANKRYRIAEPFDLATGITAIGWSTDVEIPFDLMGGWKELSADCRYVLLEGGHFDHLRGPASLLAELVRDLAGAPAQLRASSSWTPTEQQAATAVADVLEYQFLVRPHTARRVGRTDAEDRFPDLTSPWTAELDHLRAATRRCQAALSPTADPELRADVDAALRWVDHEHFRITALGRNSVHPGQVLDDTDIRGYLRRPYDVPEDRIAAFEAFLAGIPAFLDTAARTLEPRLPAGERLAVVERARAQADDLRTLDGRLAEEHPKLRAPRLVEAAGAAADATEAFGQAVEATAPVSALYGPEVLAEFLRVGEGIDRTADDLLAEARDEVDRLASALDTFAVKLGVGDRRGLLDFMLGQDSASPRRSLASLVDDLEAFWARTGVVSVETLNSLELRTRPLQAAAEFAVTGPFPEGPHPHYLYVPQPDSDAPGLLSGPMLEILAAHETFAGHYVHAEAALRLPRGIRSLVCNQWSGFSEGWAHYVEELAIEQGLAAERPLVEVAQLQFALDAAVRMLTFLSVHTGRWTFAAAVTGVTDLCGWPVATAIREVLTATSSSFASMYTLGRLQVRQWRADAGVGTSSEALRDFHDRLLACGFAPMATVWQYYLDGARSERP